MPYIITTQGQRVAVATLPEAREAVSRALWRNGAEPDSYRLVEQFDKFDASGGTVGPLPDGTVVEVEHVEWSRLREDIGQTGIDRALDDTDHDDILNAFNELSPAMSDISYADAVAYLSKHEDSDLDDLDRRQIITIFYTLHVVEARASEDDGAAAIYAAWMKKVTGDDMPTDLPGSYRKWMHRKAGRDFPVDLPNPSLPGFKVPDFPPTDQLES
jgi:hypothetical protein